jgi:hypothetical protein
LRRDHDRGTVFPRTVAVQRIKNVIQFRALRRFLTAGLQSSAGARKKLRQIGPQVKNFISFDQ